MLDIKTDPAGRLHDLLDVARRQPENKKAREALAVIFDVDSKDTESLLRLTADLIVLSQQTKARIKSLDDISHEIYLKPFSNIEKLLSTLNLDSALKPYRDLLTEPTLYGLKFGSDKLSRLEVVDSIKKSEIEALQSKLSSIVESILESELEISLKELLLRNLEGLRQALIAYRVKGLEGIEREIEAGIVSIILNKAKVQNASKDKKSESVLSGYLKILEAANKTIATARRVKELGVVEFAAKLIGVDNG